jgi:hypothetical protein
MPLLLLVNVAGVLNLSKLIDFSQIVVPGAPEPPFG